MSYVGGIVQSALIKGASLLQKSAEFLRDTSMAPIDAFIYWNWKHQEIEDRFRNGEITDEQRQLQTAHYRSALKKTAGLTAAVVGGFVGLGVRAGLMSYYGVGSAVAAVEAMCISYPAL